jgi:hypothetical protein
MKINNFNKFNEYMLEKIFESAINESIVYYSPNLRNIFKKIKNDNISDALLDVEGKNIKNDITFIDIDYNKPGYLTFTRMNKAMKNLEKEDDYVKNTLRELEKEPNLSHSDYLFDKNSGDIPKKDRNPVKLTRIINKLVDNKFTPPQIDEFSRKFIAKLTKEDQTFRIVEGDDIAFWYKSENYLEIKGDLGNSCMRNSPSYYFKIYTENPDVCRLVILVDDNEKLLGRALLWKLTSHHPKIKDELYFMDRQYTIDQTDVQRFRDFASKNGWAFKTFNSVGNIRQVTYNNEGFNLDMNIEVSGSFDYFPYMDTFKRYSSNNDTLYNDENEDGNEGDYILTDTGGGYTEIESGQWSEYYDEQIPDGYAVYSEEVSSYLHIDRAVEVTSGSNRNRGWYPEGYDDLVYDEWIEEYIHTNDAIYSEWYDYYILENDSARAITTIDSDGEPRNIENVHEDDSDFIYYYKYNDTTWFKRLSYDYSDWDDVTYTYRSLLFLNYKNKYSPLEFKLNLYKIVGLSDEASEVGFTKENLLSIQDAKILKCKIDTETSFTTDYFDYNKDIEDLLQEYFNYLKKRYEEIENILSGQQKLIEFEDNLEYLDRLKKLSKSIDKRIDEIKYGKYNNDISIEDED